MNDFLQNQYMVVFDLPDDFTEEMVNTISRQRRKVDQYFQTGKLVSYTLAADRSHLWAIFNSKDVSELTKLIEKLPMTRFLSYTYYDVMFHSTANAFPSFSVN